MEDKNKTRTIWQAENVTKSQNFLTYCFNRVLSVWWRLSLLGGTRPLMQPVVCRIATITNHRQPLPKAKLGTASLTDTNPSRSIPRCLG
jgi:hypothetical protein